MSSIPYPLLIVAAAPEAHACISATCREIGYRAALTAQRFRLILATAISPPWIGRWDSLESLRPVAGEVGYRARGFADLLAVPHEADELCALLRDYLEAA